MSTRGLTTPELNAATAVRRECAQCIGVQFASGWLRLAVGRSEISDGAGNVFYPAKSLAMEAIGESADALEGLSFSMTGLHPDIVAIAAAEPYFRRPVVLYEVHFNPDTHALLAPPRIEWLGRLSSLALEQVGGTFTVGGTAEHWGAEEDRPRLDYYNNASQVARYPTDTGLSRVEQMTELTLVWPNKATLT